MFEKIIKFGCGFIVIFFVVMICIAMCSAYFATNEASSTPVNKGKCTFHRSLSGLTVILLRA